jgi:hypothetical protein
VNQLVTPSFLFRWSFPVVQVASIPNRAGRLLELPESCRLPTVAELDGLRTFADVRLAWNAQGFGISVDVRGRTTKVQADREMLEASDRIDICIDTRNTAGVHRATKFCHRFSLLPMDGSSRNRQSPVAVHVPLPRAREEAAPPNVSAIQLASQIDATGYWLDAWLPAEVLHGFDPAASPKLGFHYLIKDRQLGTQSIAVGTEFPVTSDPSLWQILELL